MLYLVGIGLADGDISVAALETCRKSETYVDTYTSIIDVERIAYLSGLIGSEPKRLSRRDLEEGAAGLVGRAREHDIAVLVGGDPMVATTHKILFLEAKKRGVQIKVFHSASIISAVIGESGLDFYRFGSLCTVARWSEHYRPVSFYETIEKNAANNLHSIVLLDYDTDANSSIGLGEALDIMEKAEKHYGHGVLSAGVEVIVLHNVARDGQKIVMTTIGGARGLGFNNGVTSLVVPARLTDIERETAGSMYGD